MHVHHIFRSDWYSVLAFAVIFSLVAPQDGRAETESETKPSSFVDSIFTKYSGSRNESVDLSKLLSGLKIGLSAGKQGPGLGNKCYTASQLLHVFSLNKTQLDKQTFARICPAVVQQVDNKLCHKDGAQGEKVFREPKLKAWGYGFLAVTVVNVAPLLGITVVPCIGVQYYKTVLLFMVSLAVGVLCGGSVFHLIPMTFDLDGHEGVGHDYLYKCAVLVGGIYLFFVLEYLLRMFVRFGEGGGDDGGEASGGHGHSHDIEQLLFKSKGKQETVAEVHAEFYNVREDHHRAHSNSICINNDISTKDEKAPDELDHKEPDNALEMSQSRDNLTPPAKKKVKPIAWTIVIGDCLHNFIDGIAMGTAFSSSIIEGLSTAIAICGEEVPHELGDFAVLLSAGMEYKHAVFFNLLSGVICYVGLVIGLMLSYATSSVKWVYALAGGMFLYISLVDMLPEASEMSCKEGESSVKANLKTFALQNCGMLVGLGVMFVLGLYSHDIQL